MTFKQGLRKKFGRGFGFIYARVWHIFSIYAREYERGLDPEERAAFRRIFGE